MKALYAFISCALLSFLTGCVAVDAVKGRPGLDTEQVQKGASREDVETIVGAPVRLWTNDYGVTYGSYVVDAGRAGKLFGWDGGFTILMADLLTFGLIEWVSPPKSSEAEWEAFMGGGETRTIVVSFDQDEQVLGVFSEFDVLPDSGIPSVADEASSDH